MAAWVVNCPTLQNPEQVARTTGPDAEQGKEEGKGGDIIAPRLSSTGSTENFCPNPYSSSHDTSYGNSSHSPDFPLFFSTVASNHPSWTYTTS